MNLIRRFFGSKKIDCPRCLGKGHVDWDDIKRLKKELKWMTGPCAYCEGKGKISAELPSKIAVDATYLTTDLSSKERQKLITKDEAAIKRAKEFELHIDNFIAQVEHLHFTTNIEPNEIADYFLSGQNKSEIDLKAKNQLIDYIERIIKQKTDFKTPDFKVIETYQHKEKYFIKTAKWDWLNEEQIFLVQKDDKQKNKMTTMDFWPQEMFLDADGKTKIKDYLKKLIQQYKDSDMDVPPDLDEFMIENLESLESDLSAIKIVDQPTVTNPVYEIPLSKQK